MKNSYKRLIALLGVLLMLFAFVACNQTKPEISIDGNKQRSLTCGETLQFSATAKGGNVGWAINGEAHGCTLSESGLFTAGQEVAKVTVKAYIVGNESVFDTATVTVSAKSEDKPTIQIDGATTRETYCGYTVQLSATATGGNVKWKISGDNLGSTITDDGLLSVGDAEGTLVVTAYVDGHEDVYANVTLNVVKPVYGVASALGTAHNNIVLIKSFNYTFRTYFKVREYGEFDYSFYYDNVLDTTWWNVAEARANTKGAKFEIQQAYFADGGTVADGSVVEGTSKQITFGGNATKTVASGEEFTSDSVTVNVPEGHFLAFTWTIKVSATKGGSVPFTESTFATCYKKQGAYSSQENADGFVTDNAMFGSQVLIAPNKILYRHSVAKNLVFIGDSITQGVSTRKDMYEMWVAKVAEGVPTDYSVWNLGSGWATAGNLASDGAWLKKAATADEVFVCVGVNDLGGNITLAEYKKLIATIVNALRAKNPDIVITLFTVPPFNYSGTQGNTWFAMNDWIRQRNVDGVDKYFDFAAVLSQDAPNENYLINRYMSSGTDAHPNGIAGEDVARSFLNWYNGKSDSVAEVYESHINVDLNQDYTLPSFVKVRTEGGFFRYAAVEWGKQATTESVGTTVYEGNVDGTNQKAYLTLRVRNTSATNFVYEVHCANSLATADDGLVNSVYDKVFGADPTTGKQWGYVNDGEYATGQYWENNADKWEGVRCSNEGLSKILYKFELDAGTYNLSLGFRDHWGVSRLMQLSVDGVMLDNALNNGGGAETVKNYTFTVTESKVVEVLLYETTGAGANLHWLTIGTAGTPADNDLLQALAGNGFVELSWSSAYGATAYEVAYGTESGKYTDSITIDGLTVRLGKLTNNVKYFFAVRGVNETGNGGYSNEIACTPVEVADAKVLYYVDSGTKGLVRLGDKMGTCQSVEDQHYGKDSVTGKTWGYTTDGTEWLSGNPMPENSVLVANTKDADKLVGYGIHYKFEVPEGSFRVEITFYDEWNVTNRYTDIVLEGNTVRTAYCGGLSRPETLSFDVTVADGVLDIDLLGSANNADNIMVASIKIVQA